MCMSSYNGISSAAACQLSCQVFRAAATVKLSTVAHCCLRCKDTWQTLSSWRSLSRLLGTNMLQSIKAGMLFWLLRATSNCNHIKVASIVKHVKSFDYDSLQLIPCHPCQHKRTWFCGQCVHSSFEGGVCRHVAFIAFREESHQCGRCAYAWALHAYQACIMQVQLLTRLVSYPMTRMARMIVQFCARAGASTWHPADTFVLKYRARADAITWIQECFYYTGKVINWH